MTLYAYRRRPVGSCRPRIAARGADVGKNLSNAIALYERPVLVHSGPTPMRMTESLASPYPWPWVRMDTAARVPTRLDEATIWPSRSRGSLDVSLRLVGIYALSSPGLEPSGDPTSFPTIVPVLMKVQVLQYVSGTSPTLIAEVEQQVDILCYPNYVTPWYPLLTILSLGMNQPPSPAYNPDFQSGIAEGGLLRVGQLYPPDLPLLQRLRLTVNFEDADWAPSFATARQYPVMVRVTCVKDPAKSILWDPVASQTDEYVRIFCVGSEMRMRGRV